MTFDPAIFHAYDIRGTFPDHINAGVAEAVGRALADLLPMEGVVAVGRDMRLDSSELAAAAIRGLIAQGRDVVDLGLVTTDMVYYASGNDGFAGGLMVTASHNPGQYNGLKLCGREATPIGGQTGLAQIKAALTSGQFKKAKRVGTVRKLDLAAEWVDFCLYFGDASTWPAYNVAIDTGNGMVGAIMPAFERRVPLAVTPLYFEPDGSFPNHVPNPAIAANLADLTATVNAHHLDFGIAFDGDGDRTFFVDEAGRPVSASAIGAVLARDLLAKNPGATVLYDVRMSRIVPETIEAASGKPIRTPVGGGFIRPAIREQKAVLALEGAGHYYYRDNRYSDSGLITAVMIIDALARSGQRFSELIAPFNKYFDSGEINHQVADPAAKLEAVASQFSDGKQDRMDGLTVGYPDWWFNLRPSNTEPLLRLNVEATSQALLDEKLKELEALIEAS